MPDAAQLQVLYNSACPVCKAGVDEQRSHRTACEIQWDDVHSDASVLQPLDLPLERVRERLHVRDEKGQLHVGVDAFIAIWSVTPGQQWRARWLRRVRGLAAPLYNLIARQLYRWNLRRGHWRI